MRKEMDAEDRSMRNMVVLLVSVHLVGWAFLLLFSGCMMTAPGPDPAAGVENERLYKAAHGLTEYYLIADGYLPNSITGTVETLYDILDDFEGTSVGVVDDALEAKLDAELEDEPLTEEQKSRVRRIAKAILIRLHSYLPDPTAIIEARHLLDIKAGIDAALVAHGIIGVTEGE